LFSKWRSKKEVKHAEPLLNIASPLSGLSLALTDVPDETFAGGHMGQGIAIEPEEGKLIAPFDGVVAHVVKTKHALILEHSSGLQLLLHIGIDTVSLKGSGFICHIASGDVVKAGQTLIEFDLAAIQAAGYRTITPIIVTGNEVTQIADYHYGQVTAGKDMILTLAQKQ